MAEPRENSTKIKVLVTVVPEAGYVNAIGDERVEVIVAVPPGADPHTFEPSAKDLVKFSDADIYISLGKGIFPFEDNLISRLSSMNPRMKVVETAPGIDLLFGEAEPGEGNNQDIQGKETIDSEDFHKSPDPHIWVSMKNIPVIVNHITDVLISTDPTYTTYYQENRDRYIANITMRDKEIKGMLENSSGKKFITSHAAWGYFARDYGLTEMLIGQPGKEATSKEIETLITTAREQGITVVVTEPQFSRKTADLIANSINGRVIIANPLAPDIPDEIEKLAKVLSGTDQN